MSKRSIHTSKLFSRQLEQWLKSSDDKSLDGLIKLFGEKAFAIIFLILMALPALPIPTGGVTHVTELITLLAALQLIIGRRTLWLPKRWRKLNGGKFMAGKAGGKLISIIKWFERWSRPRGRGVLAYPLMRSLLGVLVVVLTVAAFVAPPFSGLDTLPAMGVVIISLGIILEDVLIILPGVIVGGSGIALEITAGAGLYHGLKHFF
jgi:hypothetical protein